jgi:hypothetical protein
MSADTMSFHVARSRRNNLGAFVDWRTRYLPEPEPAPIDRPCSVCGCRLREGNATGLCSPHRVGEAQVPSWAILLAEADPSGPHIEHLAALVAGEPTEPEPAAAPAFEPGDPRGDWKRRVITPAEQQQMVGLHMAGLNVMEIGAAVDCHYTTVKAHLRMLGYGRDHTPPPAAVQRVLDLSAIHGREAIHQMTGLTVKRINRIYAEHCIEIKRAPNRRPAWSGKGRRS